MATDMETMWRQQQAAAQAPEFKLGNLRAKFKVPPFSVLDTLAGDWQDRRRAWLTMGIESELGRGATVGDDEPLLRSGEGRELVPGKGNARTDYGVYQTGDARAYSHDIMKGDDGAAAGISIFDPVLCELAYRWFCPPGGVVLDPFAGGSVRGVVAGYLGHPYVGIDLSRAQVAANERQAAAIFGTPGQLPLPPADVNALTPVERHGDVWMKRDDLLEVAGVRGGKVRTCWQLAQGATGLVTAGSRSSPQANIVAHVAQALGIPCRVHTPQGELSPELLEAEAIGAQVQQHAAGYNNVIIARAREDAAASGWFEVPFGMECQAAVDYTAAQVNNLPAEVARIVVPVGSGMSLAGILHGLERRLLDIPVLGVVVGADPAKRLDKWAPEGWRDQVTLVPAGSDYGQAAAVTTYDGVELDAHYEAKAAPHLQAGDLLWCVGVRQTQAPAAVPAQGAGRVRPVWLAGDSATVLEHDVGVAALPAQVDLVFTCPPYFDLEVYSNDPADLSNAGSWPAFLIAYQRIIGLALERLRPGRFACIVVSEIRGPDGVYRGLVPHTIRLFEQHGARLYNEAVLVNSAGSLPLRVTKQFEASRKLGRQHQNVLVFVKGDPPKTHGWSYERDDAPQPQQTLFALPPVPSPALQPPTDVSPHAGAGAGGLGGAPDALRQPAPDGGVDTPEAGSSWDGAPPPVQPAAASSAALVPEGDSAPADEDLPVPALPQVVNPLREIALADMAALAEHHDAIVADFDRYMGSAQPIGQAEATYIEAAIVVQDGPPSTTAVDAPISTTPAGWAAEGIQAVLEAMAVPVHMDDTGVPTRCEDHALGYHATQAEADQCSSETYGEPSDGRGLAYDQLADGRWVDTGTGELFNDDNGQPGTPYTEDAGAEGGLRLQPQPGVGGTPGVGPGAAVVVRLDAYELAEVEDVVRVVAGRYERGEVAQMKFVPPTMTTEQVVRMGLQAERAVAKYLGQAWGAGVPGRPDVGQRTEVRSTTQRPASLRVYHYDHGNRYFVLATGAGPDWALLGWATGDEVRALGTDRPGEVVSAELAADRLHAMATHPDLPQPAEAAEDRLSQVEPPTPAPAPTLGWDTWLSPPTAPAPAPAPTAAERARGYQASLPTHGLPPAQDGWGPWRCGTCQQGHFVGELDLHPQIDPDEQVAHAVCIHCDATRRITRRRL